MKRLVAWLLSATLSLAAIAGPAQQIQFATSKPNSGATNGAAAPTLTGNPTLLASWDFGDASKLTLVGGKISAIAPSDGTAYTLAQATDAARPLSVTLASYGAAQFSGAQFLSLATTLGVSTSQVITVVAVNEMSSLATSGTIFSLSSNSTSGNYARHRLQINSGASGFQYRQGDNVNNTVANSSAPYPLGRHLIVGAGALSGSAVKIYKDSSATSGSVTSNFGTLAGALTRVTVGNDQDGDYLNGYTWRLLVYAGTLTTTNVDQLGTWANARWGIGGTSSSVGSSILTWNAPSDGLNDGYKIYWSQTRGGTDYSTTIGSAATLTYTVTGLTTGTWYFTIRSTLGGVEGPDVYIGEKAVS